MLDEVVISASYFSIAQAFEGAKYNYLGLGYGFTSSCLDCSGLVLKAVRAERNEWVAKGNDNPPPGNWKDVTSQYNTSSPSSFIKSAKKGDLFHWKTGRGGAEGGHAAFSNGGKSLFHASYGSGKVGFFNSLNWYLDPKQGNFGYPKVYRQVINRIRP